MLGDTLPSSLCAKVLYWLELAAWSFVKVEALNMESHKEPAPAAAAAVEL